MELNTKTIIDVVKTLTNDNHLINTFKNCFYDTKDKAVKYIDDETFLITGDIPAMWLRDSSAQVMHYLPFAKEEEISRLIKGLIKRQMRMILVDPYANAFKETEDSYGEWDNVVVTNKHSKLVWERKFELDSLCYPLFLTCKYYDYTNDLSIFNDLFYKAFDKILETVHIEQNHEELSEYFFGYTFPNNQTIECHQNKVNPNNYGLVWCGFRPSDDLCEYHYHIPDNMFLVSSLIKLKDIFENKLNNKHYATICGELADSVRKGIEKYGIQEIEGFGKIYVSETDCNGKFTTNDDANIPSLLSIPYLEYPYIDKEIYENTRKFILSKRNNFYYDGKYIKGIGSPHTPKETVWPLAVIMQGLTTYNENEIKECLNMLLSTDAGTELMHESININDPAIFTRSWFGWANSLFAEFCLRKIFKLF